VKELQEARKVFEGVRPHGSHDAEAAYKKKPELVREAAGGQVNRAVRALQLETEIRWFQDRNDANLVLLFRVGDRPETHVSYYVCAFKEGDMFYYRIF
jgi:hypothetical protein